MVEILKYVFKFIPFNALLLQPYTWPADGCLVIVLHLALYFLSNLLCLVCLRCCVFFSSKMHLDTTVFCWYK